MIIRLCDNLFMENEIIKWFQAAIDASGLSQKDVGQRLGLNRQPAISEIIAGKRTLKAHEMLTMGQISGLPVPDRKSVIPVLGYVGAGAEVYPIDDGDPLYEVVVNSALPAGTVGAIIRGDSMFPIFEDGDLVAYAGDELTPEVVVGKTCMVKLEDDRMLIKTIRRGSADGMYTLTSTNAPDIADVRIVWARSLVMRISRDFWRKM